MPRGSAILLLAVLLLHACTSSTDKNRSAVLPANTAAAPANTNPPPCNTATNGGNTELPCQPCDPAPPVGEHERARCTCAECDTRAPCRRYPYSDNANLCDNCVSGDHRAFTAPSHPDDADLQAACEELLNAIGAEGSFVSNERIVIAMAGVVKVIK